MGATPYLEGFCATYIDWHIRAGSWLYAPLTSIVASVFMCASLLILVWRMASNYRAAYDYSAVSLFASAKERVVQILPVYFWFAQLVCFWFTLTAISLFLPYESEASMVTGHVIYCGHGFMDNFLIVLAYQKSTDGPAVRRTVAVVLFICLVKAVLLIVYSDRDLGCGWCSTFFPVPQAGYMDMALAACYVFMCASVYVPSLERFRPRTTILPWILFMAVSYFTVSVAAGMNEARLDVGLCVESVAVYIYAAGYAIILYISFARDSAYWHGFDNRLLNASDGAMGSPMRTKSGSMVLGTPRNHGSVQSALQRLQDLHVVVVPWRELHLGPRLGSGGFGEVFRAKWRTTPVAVKRLYPLPNGGVAASQGHAGREAKALELLVSFGKEASIMQQLRHPNIVMLMGVSATRAGDLVMVTELMDRGSVFDVMAVTGKPLDLYATARVGLHTCRGMAYLHGFNPKIIHRDLKCANLLLDKQWTVKCADFGLSRELMSAATTRVGSVQWAAPEILRGEEYTEKCDVFSFGVCVWECLSGQVPYHGMSPVAVVTKVGTQGMQLSLPAPHTPTSIAYAPPVMAAGGSAPLAPQRGVGGVRGDDTAAGAGAGAAAGAGRERRAGRQKSTSSPAIQVVVQPANTAAAAGAQPVPAGVGAGVAAGHGAGAGGEAAAGAQGTPAVGGHNAGALPAPLAPQPSRDADDRPPRSGPSRTPSRKRAVMAPPASSSSQRSRGTSSASESGESESMVIIRRIFRNCVREEPGKRPSFPQLVAAFELMIAKTPRTRLP